MTTDVARWLTGSGWGARGRTARDVTLLSVLAGRPPLSWLLEVDHAIDEAWDLSDPLLRGEPTEGP